MMAAVMSLLIGPTDPVSVLAAIVLPILAGMADQDNQRAGRLQGRRQFHRRHRSACSFFLIGAVLASVSGQHVRADGIAPALLEPSPARVRLACRCP